MRCRRMRIKLNAEFKKDKRNTIEQNTVTTTQYTVYTVYIYLKSNDTSTTSCYGRKTAAAVGVN